MLSRQYIREHTDEVRAMLRRRRIDAPLDDVLALDTRFRALTGEVEQLRAEQNAAGKRIGGTKDAAGRQTLIAAQKGVSDRVKQLEPELKAVEEQLQHTLYQIPNIVHPDVPEGEDEHDNVVVREAGVPRVLDFPAKPHWELGEALGIIDFEAGVKLAGSRFYVLRREGARLQRALIQFMLDLHVHEHGMEEIYPPFLAKEASFWASGHMPKFYDMMYRDAEDDLWLVPSAEVPLANLYRGEIIEAGQLPLHYVSYTACFRREKMSAGRDVRGIKRGHQFDKVEMFTFCEPERSMDELGLMMERALAVCGRLGLAARVLQLCSGDLGFKEAITYDIEVWAPGQDEWLEVSSVSNVWEYQARRAEIRFRREAGGRTEHPHMLNGSGLALPRVMIAIIENYQQPDGSIAVPDALQPYMRTDRIAAR